MLGGLVRRRPHGLEAVDCPEGQLEAFAPGKDDRADLGWLEARLGVQPRLFQAKVGSGPSTLARIGTDIAVHFLHQPTRNDDQVAQHF